MIHSYGGTFPGEEMYGTQAASGTILIWLIVPNDIAVSSPMPSKVGVRDLGV